MSKRRELGSSILTVFLFPKIKFDTPVNQLFLTWYRLSATVGKQLTRGSLNNFTFKGQPVTRVQAEGAVR